MFPSREMKPEIFLRFGWMVRFSCSRRRRSDDALKAVSREPTIKQHPLVTVDDQRGKERTMWDL